MALSAADVRDVPDVVRRCADAWGVCIVEPTSVGRRSWFGMTERDGSVAHVVIKVGDPAHSRREAAALGCYAQSAARLLAHDGESGVILIERVLLGDDLRPVAAVDDDVATQIIGRLIVGLHTGQSQPTGLPALAEIEECFDGPADPRVPADLAAMARGLVRELATVDAPVVLHGDLQHFNVVRRTATDGGHDTWLAIDPHGWIGDPVFDTAAMMANPRTITDLVDARGLNPSVAADVARRRIRVLGAVTGFEEERILAWSFVAGVIAELWMLQDHGLVHGGPLAMAAGLADDIRRL